MRTSAFVLGVSPDRLWAKVGDPLFQAGTTENRELVALRIVQERACTDSELALLVLAGVEHFFRCSKISPEEV